MPTSTAGRFAHPSCLCDPLGHAHTGAIFIPVTPTLILCFTSRNTHTHHLSWRTMASSCAHTCQPHLELGYPQEDLWLDPLPVNSSLQTQDSSPFPSLVGGRGSACGWPVRASIDPGLGELGGRLEYRQRVVAAPLQAPSCGICQGQIATPEPASLAPRPLSPHYFCVPGLQQHLPPSLPPLRSPASCLPPPHLCREGLLRSGGFCFPVFTTLRPGCQAGS